MDDNHEDQNKPKPAREPFTTIDDSIQQAEKLGVDLKKLTADLKKLAALKYPLAVGKAGKGVKRMPDNPTSRQIKAGARTYFLDIDRTREGKPYLKIAESRFKGEGGKRERQMILVFPEQAQEFAQAVREMVSHLE